MAIFIDVVRSEWIKLRSLRSTYWSLVVAAVAMVGLGALFSSRYDHFGPTERASINPASFSLSGFFMAQLAIGVVGVLIITNEYSTGSIRSTLAAVPQRRTVLGAKAVVLTAVVAVVAIPSSFGAFFAGQAILAGKTTQAHLSDPGALRAVVGAGLYLSALALGALALGAIIRRTAGAIATLAGLVFVLPGLVGALPSSWQNVTRFLPASAGQAIIGHSRFATTHVLTPWTGFGVFCAYVVVAVVVATFTLNRRDA